MIDAWGKIPSGILYGNTFSYGNFDQCLKIFHNSNNSNIGVVEGQYCTANVDIKKNHIPSQSKDETKGDFPTAG